MKPKTKRLLRPGVGVYLFVLALFCASALILEQYILFAGECAITLAVYIYYAVSRTRRHKHFKAFLQTVPQTLEATGKGHDVLNPARVPL